MLPSNKHIWTGSDNIQIGPGRTRVYDDYLYILIA